VNDPLGLDSKQQKVFQQWFQWFIWYGGDLKEIKKKIPDPLVEAPHFDTWEEEGVKISDFPSFVPYAQVNYAHLAKPLGLAHHENMVSKNEDIDM
jgi:hypothetical protein